MIPAFGIMQARRAPIRHRRTRRRAALGLAVAIVGALALAAAPAAVTAASSPPSPPAIEDVHGWGGGEQSTLQATIDPEGYETTYTISADCEPREAQCQQTGGTLPADNAEHPVTLQLTGIQRGITYQLAIHASSSAGDASWRGELTLPILPPNPCPAGECPPPSSPGPFPEGTAPVEIVRPVYLETLNHELKEIAVREAQQRVKEREEEEQRTKEANAGPASARDQGEQPSTASGQPESRACRVPALKGYTLAVARRALAKAHCRPGALHGPAHQHGTLYVSAQGAPAGKRLARGARVPLTLRAKASGAKRA